MKKIIYLFIVLLIFPGITISQYGTSGMESQIIKNSGYNYFQNGELNLNMNNTDSAYFSDLMYQMNKTIKSAKIGLGFSVVTNLSLLINVRMYDGYLEESKGLVGVFGMAAGTTRFIISFVTIKQIGSLEEMLAISGNNFLNDYQLAKSKKHLKVAKKASVAIPLLGIAGIGLITGGLFGIGNGNTAGYVTWSLGWACAIGGLTCSIVSSNQLTKVKKILVAENGSLSLTTGKYGIGFCYSWYKH